MDTGNTVVVTRGRWGGVKGLTLLLDQGNKWVFLRDSRKVGANSY